VNRPGDVCAVGTDAPTAKADLSRTVAAWWAQAVIGTSYVPMTSPEVEELMHALFQQLQILVSAEPFTPEAGREIGAEIVDAHFTNPKTLSQTIAILLAVPGPVSGSGEPARRWPLLIAAVAEGYAAKLVDRVRREQQEIINAALTAREDAERALQASEIRLERAREDFIATISLELRTPLTPIKGYLRTLQKTGDAIDGEQRAQYYRVMIGQVEQLEGLIEDLLAAAGLQHPHFSVTFQVVDVADVIERALENVSAEGTRRFSWRRDGRATLAVCDPIHLQQVVANLLSNADKYSPEGEPVIISAGDNGDVVEIVVHDFGPGIPPDQAEAVFEPFRRLGPPPTRGTGLGLYIARRLTEAMNGRIWVDDGTEPGTSVHVAVPGIIGP